MKTIALFNGRSGAGKTLLAYHLAWMFHHVGARVVIADLDPQADSTSAFLETERCEEVFISQLRQTIAGAIDVASRSDDFEGPHVENIEEVEEIGLIPGDPTLAGWEDRFARAWYACLDTDPSNVVDALRLTTAIERALKKAGNERNADVLLLDLASNLGAINRAALLAADAVVIPLAPDLASTLALPTLGNALTEWQKQWDERRTNPHASGLSLPSGSRSTLGYVVVQPAIPWRKEASSHDHQANRIARAFHQDVIGDAVPAGSDPSCLAWLRHVRGLFNLHKEAHKPMFDLKAADGAIGSYAYAVKDVYSAFEKLTREIANRAGVVLPKRD